MSKKRLNNHNQPALAFTQPTHADLIVRIGEEVEAWYLPIPEAAWLARMIQSIFTGQTDSLFRVGDKVTFARYASGRVQIELRPAG